MQIKFESIKLKMRFMKIHTLWLLQQYGTRHSCLFVQSISASTYPVGGVGPTIFTMIRKILHFYINTPATRNFCHAIICSENSFYFSSQILRIMRTKFGFNRNNQTHFLSFYFDSQRKKLVWPNKEQIYIRAEKKYSHTDDTFTIDRKLPRFSG